MHACSIKFVGINVRGTCLISENHEHFLYPQKVPAIQQRRYDRRGAAQAISL